MISTLRYWVKNGPRPVEEGHGTADWLLGMWLWWRVWYPSMMLVLALGGAFYALEHAGPGLGVLIGVFFGVQAGSVMVIHGPRYEVTRKY